MNIQLGIVIPVRNCLELTQATIESIKTRFPYHIYIIDDHSDKPMKEWLRNLSTPSEWELKPHPGLLLGKEKEEDKDGRACRMGVSALPDTATITSHPSVARPYEIDDESEDRKSGRPSRTDAITIFTDPPDSTGLAANWNLGIAAALNDGCTHILILNNDILLSPKCIDSMIARFDQGDVVMVTAHDIHNETSNPQDVFIYETKEKNETEHPDFACFLIGESTIRKVGWFDENYIGAYYEDNDYHAHIALRGEKAVNISWATFYHFGGSTIKKNQDIAQQRNHNAAHNGAYFQRKWGCMPTGNVEMMRASYYPCPFNMGKKLTEIEDISRLDLSRIYKRLSETSSDINEHIPYLYRLASTVSHVTALTNGGTKAAAAFLCARPENLNVYELNNEPAFVLFNAISRYINTQFHHINIEAEDIDETELLFIDTCHTEERMHDELNRHSSRVSRYIVLHDTETFGEYGEIAGTRGIWPAISDFLRNNSQWRLLQHFPNNNGLTVLARI